jgi:CheY-like chemotaxis protein
MAEKARAMLPGLAVLFTSGYTQNSIVHGGRLDAGVHLLSKPYTQEALAQKIRDVLAREPAPAAVAPAETVTQPASAVQALAAVQPAPALQFDGLCILVCEDDVIIRMSIAEGLRDAGCTVLEAGSARKALDVLALHPVAVLITDVGLPDVSGVTLVDRALILYPALAVIFATGNMQVDGVDHLQNCMVLTKPFGDTELLAAIRTVTAQRA